MKSVLVLSILFLASCVNKSNGSLSKTTNVECYSGGKLIYSTTTRKQHYRMNDRFYIVDSRTNKEVEINAECIFQEN